MKNKSLLIIVPAFACLLILVGAFVTGLTMAYTNGGVNSFGCAYNAPQNTLLLNIPYSLQAIGDNLDGLFIKEPALILEAIYLSDGYGSKRNAAVRRLLNYDKYRECWVLVYIPHLGVIQTLVFGTEFQALVRAHPLDPIDPKNGSQDHFLQF